SGAGSCLWRPGITGPGLVGQGFCPIRENTLQNIGEGERGECSATGDGGGDEPYCQKLCGMSAQEVLEIGSQAVAATKSCTVLRQFGRVLARQEHRPHELLASSSLRKLPRFRRRVVSPETLRGECSGTPAAPIKVAPLQWGRQRYAVAPRHCRPH